MSTDPIGYAGGINLYTYVGNNPVKWIDPFGWCKQAKGKRWWEAVDDWLTPPAYADESGATTNELTGTFPWFPKKTLWKDIRGPYKKSIHVTATFSGVTGPIGRTDWKVKSKFTQERYVTHRRIYFDKSIRKIRIIDSTTKRQTRIIERVMERGVGSSILFNTGGNAETGQVWLGEGGPAGTVGGRIDE